MVVVVSRSSRQSWEIESFVIWILTHQMPPIPSWFHHGRRAEYLGFRLYYFWRGFRARLFREARSRKEIKALNAEVT